MLNTQKRQKNTVVFIAGVTAENTPTNDVIDELLHLSLSKCFQVQYHELIYEIATFHYINGETCDQKHYGTPC